MPAHVGQSGTAGNSRRHLPQQRMSFRRRVTEGRACGDCETRKGERGESFQGPAQDMKHRELRRPVRKAQRARGKQTHQQTRAIRTNRCCGAGKWAPMRRSERTPEPGRHGTMMFSIAAAAKQAGWFRNRNWKTYKERQEKNARRTPDIRPQTEAGARGNHNGHSRLGIKPVAIHGAFSLRITGNEKT